MSVYFPPSSLEFLLNPTDLNPTAPLSEPPTRSSGTESAFKPLRNKKKKFEKQVAVPSYSLRLKTTIEENLSRLSESLTKEEGRRWQIERDQIFSEELALSEQPYDVLDAITQMDKKVSKKKNSKWSRVRDLQISKADNHTLLMKRVCKLRALEKLTLENMEISRPALDYITEISKLSLLIFNRCTFTRVSLRITPLTSLKTIIFNNNPLLTSEHLRSLPLSLTSLTVKKCPLVTGTLFTYLKEHKFMTSLAVEDCALSQQTDLTPLLKLDSLTSLTLLTQNHSVFGLTKEHLSVIAQHPRLSEVTLGICRKLSKQDREILKQLPQLKQFKLCEEVEEEFELPEPQMQWQFMPNAFS